MTAAALPPEHPVYAKVAETCRPLYFDDVSFTDLTDVDGTDVLSVTGILPLSSGGQYMTVWRGIGEGQPDESDGSALWMLLSRSMPPAGRGEVAILELQKSDTYLGLGDLGNRDDLAPAVGTLVRLFETAEPGHKDLSGSEREMSFHLLNAACMGVYESAEPEALTPSEHEHGEGKPWFSLVDRFTDLCRRGPLNQVSLRPSEYGGVDITAHIWPPLLKDKVVVRVFHHQGPGESLPGHWYGVGDATTSAHAAYVDFAGLCAAYPESSHAFIEHALDGHLHAMCHEVYDVLIARLEEKDDFLRSLIPDDAERAARAQELAAPVWQDCLAGFSGIAMMFTGYPEENTGA